MTNTRGYQRFFAELKRRHVFRVMAVYGATAFVIIEAADVIFPAIPLPPWTVSLVVWLALLGFPVAIVLAWALEMTPEGVRRTSEASPGELTEIIASPFSKRWPAGVYALVGVVLLVGAWYAGRQSAPESSADESVGLASASIAVLPFADMSPERDQEYFSEGISEELLNLLAKLPELQVAARTSSFSFKDQSLGIPEIARRLNVSYVLEGSVRKSGVDIRITTQLIRADDGFHVWSDTWDRTLDDIFSIQDEIAAEVVGQLKVRLLGEVPTAEEADAGAYALFLQARQLRRQGGGDRIDRSNGLYQQALEIDPNYAGAWVGLASNYAYQAGFGLGSIDDGYRLAREAANRALAIDRDFAPAYAVLGQIAADNDRDLATAARHMQRALELDLTNTDVLHRAAALLEKLGRLGESIALKQYVIARDPVNPGMHVSLCVSYFYANRMDEAIESCRTAQSLNPGGGGANFIIGVAQLWKNQPEEALAAMQQETYEPFRELGLTMAYHALGRVAESDAVLARVIEELGPEWAYNIAYVEAFRGEADAAFEWLDKAAQVNDPGLSLLAVPIQFESIMDDPRWLPFLESIGKSPAQLAAIEFEVRLPQ